MYLPIQQFVNCLFVFIAIPFTDLEKRMRLHTTSCLRELTLHAVHGQTHLTRAPGHKVAHTGPSTTDVVQLYPSAVV